jgi:putative FmdB family regulatory protein
MPFYEYECSSCKYYLEVMQKVSDAPLRKCPSCGRSTLKKLVSAPVFRLKGSGWYETDFKSDKEGKRNLAVEKEEAREETKAEAKEGAAGESKPEAKVEAKPEPKPEAKPASKVAAKRASRLAPRSVRTAGKAPKAKKRR